VLGLELLQGFLVGILAVEERVEARRHLVVGAVDGAVFGTATAKR